MLHVLERFELESADGGHGAFFPDNQPQLLTHGVSEGLGSSLFLRPDAAQSRGVPLCSQGQGEALVGVENRQRPGGRGCSPSAHTAE